MNDADEFDDEMFPPAGWTRLRGLRRVVPVAQTVAVGGVVVAVLSLDDYAEGFAVRVRLWLEDDHPVAAAQRRRAAEFRRRREEAARAGELEAFVAAQEAAFLARDEWHDEDFPPKPLLALAAVDDRGGRYRHFGGEEAWGTSLVLRTEPAYSPGLDPAARELRLEAAEVPWRARGRRGEGGVVAVARGPWAFAVPL